MQFVVQDLIDRARVYLDDDHKEADGWIDPAKWLVLFNVERANLYRKWVRMGLVRPAPKTNTFVGTTTLAGVLAVIGVGEDLGSFVRLLTPAQVTRGADPFWPGSTPIGSKAIEWAAHGSADDLTIELDAPADTTTYTVRWLPTLPYVTDATQVVDLPDGCDERLVLGLARRAMVKEVVRSALVEQLIREADEEVTFSAVGKNGGMCVRRVQNYRTTLPDRFSTFPTDQRFWQYV